MSEAGIGGSLPPSLTHGALVPLNPSYKGAYRLSMLIVLAIVIMGLAILDLILSSENILPWGAITAAAFLVMAPFALLYPGRRYASMGYRVDDDAILVARGRFFRRETLVPFARIQHLDVQRGPIERAFGLASLDMSTAGSRNGIVVLPGLSPETAEALRESIRNSIKRELG